MNEYIKINWQDGSVLQPATVTIDGTDYNVTPAVESGTTPVNATNLNKMDTALKQAHDGVRDMEANKIDKSTIELLTVDSTAPEHCSTGDMYYNTTTNLIYKAIGTDTWGTTGETPSSKYLYVDLANSKLYYYDGANFTSYGEGGASLSNVYGTSNENGYTQQYINGLQTYSTTEQRIGTWIDNKPLYRKVINFGALPNATTKDVAHGISNLKNVIKIDGIAISGQYHNPLPLVYNSADAQYNTEIFVGNTYITMKTTQNRSSMTAYVYLEYTKTTD
jgi:hypothetical protein